MEATESRLKLFFHNIISYGFVTILSKMIPIIMLPIITKLLTDTADFGTFDMFNTIVDFGTNIAILGLYDAMFREYFEKDSVEYKKVVTSSALDVVCISSLVIAGILFIFRDSFSIIFLGDSNSGSIVCFAAVGVILGAITTIIAAPTRMENKTKVYVVINTSKAILYYLVAIGLVWLGYNYLGMIYANLISGLVILFCFLGLNFRHFQLRCFDRGVAKELLRMGLPMTPVFIIYWIFHSMDKIMITNMLGLGEVGIYSIGARIASVSQLIYSAFAGGWQYFAFSTMEDKDQIELNQKIMEYLGIVSYIAVLCAVVFDEFVFRLFFSGDYEKGYIVFPYLFLAPLILMLFQICGNQCLVYKKTYLSTLTLCSGVLVNLAINYFTIPIFGIKGASLATLLSYVTSLVVMLIVTVKKEWMRVSSKFVSISFLVLAYMILIFFVDYNICNLLAISLVVVIAFVYMKEIKGVFMALKRLKK